MRFAVAPKSISTDAPKSRYVTHQFGRIFLYSRMTEPIIFNLVVIDGFHLACWRVTNIKYEYAADT